jgi:hypothetical protein
VRWGKGWGLATPCIIWLIAVVFVIGQARGAFGAFSTFPSSFAEPPLAWWPLTSWATLAATGLAIIWAFAACWLIRYLARPALASIISIAVCALLMAAAVVYERPSGFGLYQDRLIYRTVENNFVAQTVPYTAVTRIRVGCGYYRVRRSKRVYATPIYEVFLADGQRFELDEPAANVLPRPIWPHWVALMTPIHERIRAGGVAVDIADLSGGEPSCFTMFEQELNPEERSDWRRMVRPADPTV